MKRFNAHQEHKPNDETDQAISFINSQDLGWTADVCKLQKNHKDYGSHCDQSHPQEPQGELLAQISTEEIMNKKKEFGKKGGKEFEAALAEA